MRYLVLIVTIQFASNIYAQTPRRYNSSEIYKKIQKLNVLGNALYMAAHPDDENTRLITYLSNAELINTAYLSLTRGDGGQNSIGPEQSELLGVIRTQELLSARRVDGGTQFFTRVMDFGYSKSADETLNIWSKEEILEDAIWIVRKFKPDVIITRFPADGRAGHGQHEASSIIANEAFELAVDPDVFPGQLKYVEPWQPSKLFLNTGRWWNQEISESDSVLSVDIGLYDPLTGLSYSELGADSRSKHRSQAFGVTWTRGTSKEYLEFQKGMSPGKSVFDGIDVTWNRIHRKDIQEDVLEILKNYDVRNPSASIADIFKVRKKIDQLEDDFWRKIKLQEVDEIIRAAAGLYLEATSNAAYFSPGDEIEVNIEITNRSDLSVVVQRISSMDLLYDTLMDMTAGKNVTNEIKIRSDIHDRVRETSPYWLVKPVKDFRYNVTDPSLKGLAQNPPSIQFEVKLIIDNEPISYFIPVVYTWTDRMKGQQYEPLEIGPRIFLDISDGVFIFPDNQEKIVNVKLETMNQEASGILSLKMPDGWRSIPEQQSVGLKAHEITYFQFRLYPPAEPSHGMMEAIFNIDGTVYNRKLVTINYDHFPKQSIFLPASAKIVKLDIAKRGSRIAYINGAGDEVGPALEQIGYRVSYFDEFNIGDLNFDEFDAIVFGIMAFNNHAYLAEYQQQFLDFIHNGGNVIVQYNNIRIGTKSPILMPYPIEFSGWSASVRVSEENALVRVLKPDHAIMTYPNKIDTSDFDGWVQERALYMPVKWDERYDAILSSNDPGEEPLDGGLLVAPYGKGYFIYTSYAWFRQLPAGVPGAYRIYANLISVGK